MDEEQDEGVSQEEMERNVGGLLRGYSEEQRRIEELRNQAMQKFIDELNELVEQKDKEIEGLNDRFEEQTNKINDFKRKLGDLVSEL